MVGHLADATSGPFRAWLPLLAALAAICPLSPPAFATTYTWDASPTSGIQAGNGTWDSSATNWTADGGVTRVAWSGTTNSAVFSAAGTSLITFNLGILVQGVTFDPGATGYTISGGTLDPGAGGITANESAAIYSNFVLMAPQTWATASGKTLSITTSVIATTGGLWTIGGDGDTSIAASIIGVGGLTKSGTGTLILKGANTYTGGTRITAGTLTLGYYAALQNSIVDMNSADTGSLSFGAVTSAAFGGLTGGRNVSLLNSSGGAVALTVGGSQTSTYSGNLSGSGSLTKSGIGTVTLSGADTFSGNTRIAAGMLTVTNSLALQYSTVDMNISDTGSPSFDSLTSATFGGLMGGRSLALANTSGAAVALTVGGNNQTTTYAGILSGSGSLTKSGTGTLTLSGANTFTGNTRITAGVLTLANALALQKSTVDMNCLDAGSLNFGSLTSATFGGLMGGRSLALANTSGAAVALTVGGNNQTTTYAGILSGSGSLTKSGIGSLTLSGTNTFSGNTRVTAGTLTLADPNALQNSTVNMNQGDIGNLDFGSLTTATFGGLMGGKNVTLQNSSSAAVALTVGGNNQTTTYTGILSGDGSLTKVGNGSLYLQGAGNSYAGATAINAGSVYAQSYNAFGLGDVTVNNGATVYAECLWALGDANVTVNSGGRLDANEWALASWSSWSNPVVAVHLRGGTLSLHLDDSQAYPWLGGNISVESNSLVNVAGGMPMDNPGLITSLFVSNATVSVASPDGSAVAVGSLGIDGNAVLDIGSGVTLTAENYAGGSGQLIKKGPGTLCLCANGPVTVLEGVLDVMNGSTLIGSGSAFIAPNPVVTATIRRSVGTGSPYAGLGATVLGGRGTAADILAGSNASGQDQKVTWQWRLSEAGEPVAVPMSTLVSEVLNLGGMGIVSGGEVTSPFVLQMTYDPNSLDPTLEADLAAKGSIFLAWLDPATGAWENAVFGDFGGAATFAGIGAWSDYGQPGLDDDLGRWGVNPADHTVWAVVNHNSEFAVVSAVPEPGSMLFLAAAMLVLRARRRGRVGG